MAFLQLRLDRRIHVLGGLGLPLQVTDALHLLRQARE